MQRIAVRSRAYSAAAALFDKIVPRSAIVLRKKLDSLLKHGNFDDVKTLLEAELAFWKSRLERKGLTWGKFHRVVRVAELEAELARLFRPFEDALAARRRYQKLILDKPILLRARARAIRVEFGILRPDRFRESRLNSNSIGRSTSYRFDEASGEETRLNFSDSIYGRSVVLIGGGGCLDPGFSEFDVIASVKMGVDAWTVPKLLEDKVLLSYLNGSVVQRLIEGSSQMNQFPTFLRFKSKNDLRVFRSKFDLNSNHSALGVARNNSRVLDNRYGALTGIIALLDILSHRPSSVFVTGFDFYGILGASHYREGYPTSAEASTDTINKSLRIHEPFSNFGILKNLYENRMIDADDSTSRVLKLSPSRFAQLLDQRMGRVTYDAPS